MTTNAAIAIGIKRAGNLAELPGAINGAKDFAGWAVAQRYDTQLITDETEPVTVSRLKSAIKTVIDKGQAQRLLIYFAGHGIQPTVNTAYWLLSNWQTDSDEAVNVNLSFSNAKRTPLGQICVISDACRSTVPDAALVGGSSIFPKPSASPEKLPQWDHFLASRLGEAAQEVAGRQGDPAYGIFTRCIMEALRGNAAQAIEERAGPMRVVTSAKIADYLEDAVPLESGKTAGAAVQFPEVTSGWRTPNDIYLELPVAIAMDSLEANLAESLDTSAASTSDRVRSRPTRSSSGVRSRVTAARKKRDAAIEKTEAELAAGEGRRSFETGQGLSIIGDVPVDIRVGRSGATLFDENGAWHVRGRGGHPQSILVKLQGGNWIATAIIPNFVGTIVVVEGCAASMNYSPVLRDNTASLPDVAPMVHRWNALMGHGRTADYRELRRSAEELREFKHSNPSLGVLATYAYERAGIVEEIDSIARYFAMAEQPIPFDAALLSTYSTVTQNRPMLQTGWGATEVAGMFPLMTQGWAFLDPDERLISPDIYELRSGLVPSLWTTLTAEAGEKLAQIVQRGDR